MTGVDQGDNGIQLAGNDYGCQVVNNRFVGAIPFYIHCQTTNTDGTTHSTAPGPYGTNSAPEKWTHGPILGLVMTGNTFEFESGASPTSVITLDQASDRAYTSGRVYLSGTVTNNSFQYKTTPTAAALRIGEVGYNGPSNADSGAVNLATIGNWVKVVQGQVNGTVQVNAGTVYHKYANQAPDFSLYNQTYNLETVDPNNDSSHGPFGIPLGLDALDYAGLTFGVLGRPGFDQYQDFHIRLYALRDPNGPSGSPITNIEILPLGGRRWQTTADPNIWMAYKYEVNRPSRTADLYFQPDQDEDGSLGYDIKVHYLDNAVQEFFVSGVICNAKTPTPPRTALGGKPGPYSGVLSGNFSGEYGGGGPNPINSDGRADFAIYRATEAFWAYLSSSNGADVPQSFGMLGDVPCPADYDGDGRTDFAFYRPSTGGFFYKDVRTANDGQYVQQQSPFGRGGDLPCPADLDGDKKADYLVFRPYEAKFYYTLSGENNPQNLRSFAWGQSSDFPLPRDYDGDGKADFAVYRPSEGTWDVSGSSRGHFMAKLGGQIGDVPVPRNFAGHDDGRTDFAIYRTKSTEFITLDSTLGDSVLLNPGPSNLGGQVLGLWGDVPVPANYGGVDKKADFAVFRPWTNQFISIDSRTGQVVFQYLGYGGDVPVS